MPGWPRSTGQGTFHHRLVSAPEPISKVSHLTVLSGVAQPGYPSSAAATRGHPSWCELLRLTYEVEVRLRASYVTVRHGTGHVGVFKGRLACFREIAESLKAQSPHCPRITHARLETGSWGRPVSVKKSSVSLQLPSSGFSTLQRSPAWGARPSCASYGPISPFTSVCSHD